MGVPRRLVDRGEEVGSHWTPERPPCVTPAPVTPSPRAAESPWTARGTTGCQRPVGARRTRARPGPARYAAQVGPAEGGQADTCRVSAGTRASPGRRGQSGEQPGTRDAPPTESDAGTSSGMRPAPASGTAAERMAFWAVWLAPAEGANDDDGTDGDGAIGSGPIGLDPARCAARVDMLSGDDAVGSLN